MSFEQNPLSARDSFIRRCTGHTGKGQIRCPADATRVCTDKEGMQWYACDNDEHIVASPDGAPVMHVESLESFLDGVLAADAERRLAPPQRCEHDVHENCVLLAPGDERVDGIVVLCTITVLHGVSLPNGSSGGRYASTCGRRPVYRCTACGALVCEKHAGKRCPAVDGRGRQCVIRLAMGQWQRHEHEYQS